MQQVRGTGVAKDADGNNFYELVWEENVVEMLDEVSYKAMMKNENEKENVGNFAWSNERVSTGHLAWPRILSPASPRITSYFTTARCVSTEQ